MRSQKATSSSWLSSPERIVLAVHCFRAVSATRSYTTICRLQNRSVAGAILPSLHSAGPVLAEPAAGGQDSANMSPSPAIRGLAEQAARTIRARLGPETKVLWFGSWVQGTAVERSDVDLGIDTGSAVEGAKRARLEEDIEALPTLRGIDIVDLWSVAPEFRARVLREGVPL
jgi:predicted nucleotidyltransferase